MASSSPKQGRFETNSKAVFTLIESALRAARSEDKQQLLARLEKLRQRFEDPAQLELALRDSALVELVRSCLSNVNVAVRQETLSIFLDTLLDLGRKEFPEENFALLIAVLRLIQAEVLNLAVRSDLFQSAFNALSGWCSLGKAHRGAFLEVFPIDQLSNYDVFHYPSDVLAAYTELIRSVLDQGRHRLPLFKPVLKIFQKTLSCPGNTCYNVKEVSDSINRALKKFENEDPIGEVLKSSFIDLLVRHTMTREACKRHCLNSIVKLTVECLEGGGKDCQRLLDQGMLDLMSACLTDDHFHLYKKACWALATVFASSLNNIDKAHIIKLVGSLLSVRENPDDSVKKEARNALLQFFTQATPQQIFAVFEYGHLPLLVKLLRSSEASFQVDGLRWLFALISATRASHPQELSKLHQQMVDLDVKTTCEKLKNSEKTYICSLAHGLLNFVNSTFEN